ncbi:MAG: ankyrin repeat domain-containing protein [Gammaproteobacteria bacterium]
MRYGLLLTLAAGTLGWACLSGAAELADAVMHGDAVAIDRLLTAHSDVNEPRPDGGTALHWAVYRNDLVTARKLLTAGANVATVNEAGVAPLLLAAERGNPDMIALLLDAGAAPNATLKNGETALMMAARTGNVAAIEVLTKHGVDVNAREQLRGTTALMWAAAYKNPGAVGALLEHGADASLRSSAIPRGRRPYLAPSGRERIEQVKRGLNVSGVVKLPTPGKTAPPPPPTDDDGAPVQRQATPDWGGLTALVFAAREGDLASAKILLDHGVDVNQTSEYGWTPLLTASQNRYYQLGKFFLERGADPNIANKGGWNPLYIATDNRNIEGGDYPTRKPDMDHLEFIKLLIERGANVDARMASSTETRTVFTHQWLYEEGATPFLRASQSGDMSLLKLLLEHGADPTINTDTGVTPLMVASGIGWVEGVTYEWSKAQTLDTVKLLLDLGNDVNARDTSEGRTALMGAAHKGRTDVIAALVEHGAKLDTRDVGSRDTIYRLAGVTWQAIDYADGLVRVGVQSAIPHPEAAALLRDYMTKAGLKVPPAGRTLDSICVTDLCR